LPSSRRWADRDSQRGGNSLATLVIAAIFALLLAALIGALLSLLRRTSHGGAPGRTDAVVEPEGDPEQDGGPGQPSDSSGE